MASRGAWRVGHGGRWPRPYPRTPGPSGERVPAWLQGTSVPYPRWGSRRGSGSPAWTAGLSANARWPRSLCCTRQPVSLSPSSTFRRTSFRFTKRRLCR